MTYKTYWLAGLLAPMLVATPVQAVKQDMVTTGHTMFLDAAGSVYGMGSNMYNKLTSGGGNFYTPIYLGITNAHSVAATTHRSAIQMRDGTAVLRGYDYVNYAAMAPQPFPSNNITDIALNQKVAYYVSGGQVFSWAGEPGSQPVALSGGANVKNIAAGNTHLIVLFNDGTVGTYGTGAYGQLGGGDVLPRATITKLTLPTTVGTIAAGPDTSFLKMNDGKVMAFGRNTQYQLGLPDMVNRTVPTITPITGVNKIRPMNSATYMIMDDGKLNVTGWHNLIDGGGALQYNTNIGWTNIPIGGVVDDMAVGNDSSIVLQVANKGQLKVWGGALNGKLGTGNQTELHTITQSFYTPVEFAPEVPLAPPPVVTAPVVTAPVVTTTAPVVTTTVAPVETTTLVQPTVTTQPTVVEVVVNTVVAVISTVVDAVVAVVDAVVDAVAPTKGSTSNNGFGNGDQTAPGNSASKNNAENAVNPKVIPTVKPKG